MAEITLDKSKTALLMADFSAGTMAQNPLVHERQTFERAGEVLAAARKAGIFVTYCISHLGVSSEVCNFFTPVPAPQTASRIDSGPLSTPESVESTF